MAVTRNNRIQYSPEQYERAKQNNHTLDYVKSHGYELVEEGRYYHLKEHDSLVFSPNGSWFWNSRGMKGQALDFIVHYEGRSWAEAVLILAGEAPELGPAIRPNTPRISDPAPKEKPVFQLPPRANDERQLFAYLCGTRKLSYRLVKMMLSQGILYEASCRTRNGEQIHRNACFVSLDPTGKPCSGFLRGLYSAGTAYKGEIPGGNKCYGWLLKGGFLPQEVYVFEAAIDAASYADLQLLQYRYPRKHVDFLALGGLSIEPIHQYLKDHPSVYTVHLMLDADKWGVAAAERFRKKLEAEGCQVTSAIPPYGKDWNDTLRYVKDPSMCSRIDFT